MMNKKDMLVIRVKGIIDLKRMKELVKIYKEVLGEQPFIIVDDEVREIEPFYDYRENDQKEETDESKVEGLTLRLLGEGYTYHDAINVAREHYGFPKLDDVKLVKTDDKQEITYNADLLNLTNLPNYEKLQDGIVPLVFEEGKVADVEIENGEVKAVHPGGSIKDFDSLMNAGKNEIPGDKE
jgi:hypothetical protein